MKQIKLTGGAKIGNAHATFPLASLCVTKDVLELNAGLIGTVYFQPKDIVSFENNSRWSNKGLKINHRVSSYKENIVFSSNENIDELIKQIHSLGFVENDFNRTIENEDALLEKQNSGVFAIKIPVAIGLVVLWNALFLWSFFGFSEASVHDFSRTLGIKLALAMVIVFSILCLISKDFAKLVLKKGRTVKDIDKALYFLIIIAGLMLINLTFLIPRFAPK